MAAAVLAACGEDAGPIGADPNNDSSLPPVAGSGGVGGGEGSAGAQLPCDIDAILGKSCRSCHGAQLTFGAPMPLITYADLTAPWKGGKVYEAVERRIHADTSRMPPAPNPPLDTQALAAVDAWVAGGAKPGSAACRAASDGGTSNTEPQPLACASDQHIRPAAPSSIPQGITDLYVCYGFDTTVTSDRHVIAIAPHVDNKAILHHVLLMQSETALSPQPTICDGSFTLAWRLYSVWVPGQENIVLPDAAGVRESGTTHWVVQAHLNNSKGLSGQTDASGFDLCTTDKLRPNDADVTAFGTLSISLAPRANVDIGSAWFAPSDLHVFGTIPHMHKLGKSLSTTIIHNGQSTSIANVPSYDFNSQVFYATDSVIKAGDTVQNHCVYDNTTDQTVTFGESTGNEMCFDFTFYYPKITTNGWTWMTPATDSIRN
jgi:hypothetical protein